MFRVFEKNFDTLHIDQGSIIFSAEGNERLLRSDERSRDARRGEPPYLGNAATDYNAAATAIVTRLGNRQWIQLTHKESGSGSRQQRSHK